MGYSTNVITIADEVNRHAVALSEQARVSALHPVLVEARPLSVKEIVARAHKMGWNTHVSHLGDEMAARDLGPIDDLSALQTLVSDTAHVHFVAKGFENQAPYICIGRAKRNDLVLQDPRISSLHAALYIDAEQQRVVLEDRGSSNGTYVNGRRLRPREPVTLGLGDCLRFGNRVFYFLPPDRYRDFVELRLSLQAR